MASQSVINALGFAGRKLWRQSSSCYSEVAAMHVVVALNVLIDKDCLPSVSTDPCTMPRDLDGAWIPPVPTSCVLPDYVPNVRPPTTPEKLPKPSKRFRQPTASDDASASHSQFAGAKGGPSGAPESASRPSPCFDWCASGRREVAGHCVHTEALLTPSTAVSAHSSATYIYGTHSL